MAFQAQKGTKDMLPQDAYKWKFVKNTFMKVAESYTAREIRTPVFEATDLFERGVGDTTDVVQKEMYTFNDKGGRSITLKPEGTAGSVRAFIESSLYSEAQPTKLFYITPVYRYENVQKGRLREHHQMGVEFFGSKDATIDAEVIAIAYKTLINLGIKDIKAHINSIGTKESRVIYNEKLKEYFRPNLDKLCKTCNERFEKNPMRILDCKVPKCHEIAKSAPRTLDYLDEESKIHFEELKKNLEAMGIPYVVDPDIVRGLDYYTKTVFEIIKDGITICGGGRYDNLIEEIGGPDMPACGFGMGIERVLLQLENEGIEIVEEPRCELYVAAMGEEAKKRTIRLITDLRDHGVKAEIDHMGRSLKAQMKYANKMGAKFTMVLGEDEINRNSSKLKNMETHEEKEITLDTYSIVSELRGI